MAARLALLAATTVALVALAEAALRLTARRAYYVWPPNLRRVMHPAADALPGVTGDSRFTVNRWGIRGDPFSRGQKYRILALGGSTTECLFLDDAEAWPYLLQRDLNARLHSDGVWVGNVGKSGGTTRHHVVQIQELLPQYPRIDAVLLLVGVNDLHLGLLDQRPPPIPFGDPRSPEYAAFLPSAFSAPPGWDAGYPFFKRTELWRRLRSLRYAFAAPPPDTRLVLDEAGACYREMREDRRKAAIRGRLPDLASPLAEYEENIRVILRAAAAAGARAVFATQPVLWRPDLPAEMRDLLWMGGAGDFGPSRGKEYYSVEALSEGMRLYNERLLAVCKAEGAECVDLASMLPRDLTVFYDDTHFNEGGSRRVAELLADCFVARGLREAIAARGRR